jgi:hypothetical protein|tara:strand:+ start:157 stop:282 length:126 start_codon:yes stop_codon:yes gene_type:complete
MQFWDMTASPFAVWITCVVLFVTRHGQRAGDLDLSESWLTG